MFALLLYIFVVSILAVSGCTSVIALFIYFFSCIAFGSFFPSISLIGISKKYSLNIYKAMNKANQL